MSPKNSRHFLRFFNPELPAHFVAADVSFQFQPAPILRTSLNPWARCPGDPRLVDVFAQGGAGFVAVINNEVKTDLPGFGVTDVQLAERERRLDTVAVTGAL